MDVTSMALSSAQTLVNAILTDTWTAVRNRLTRRHGSGSQAGSTDQSLAVSLDAARHASLEVAGTQDDRTALMEAFWAGYLLALANERPDVTPVLRELEGQAVAHTVITNSGTVRDMVQADRIEGGVRFGDGSP